MRDIVNVRGTIAANGRTVIVSTGGQPGVGIELEGIWVGTLHIQETVSGDGFVDAQVTNAANTPVSAVVTGNGKFFVAAAGRSAIQVIATAWTSGTATVVGVPTAGGGGGSSGGGGAITAAVGAIVDGADTALGTTTDTAATSDAGAFSLLALVKRGLQGITSLLAALPSALVGGRLDVNLGAAPAALTVGTLPALAAGTNTIGKVGVTSLPGVISTANSSTTLLNAGLVFTGTSEDVSGYAAIVVNGFADVASAAGGLAPQFSSDGTHWDFAGAHTISAGVGAQFIFRPGAQFFRLVYTNGGTNQASFRLQTVYHEQDIDLATVQALGAGLPNPTTIQVGADLLVQPSGGTTWSPLLANSDGSLPVGGFTSALTVTPTITAGAYTSGFSLGGTLALANATRIAAGSGVIQSITVTDKAKANNAIDFLFFIAGNPTSTTATDHAALTVNVADLVNCLLVSFPASAYSTLATNSVGTLASLGLPFKLTTGQTLYCMPVARGTTAYSSTSDVSFRVGVLQD